MTTRSKSILRQLPATWKPNSGARLTGLGLTLPGTPRSVQFRTGAAFVVVELV
jgi:hypothetical protein